MSEEYAYLVLASWATKISRVIIQICTERSKSIPPTPRRIAGEIAVRLGVIGPALKSLQPYGVEPSIEGLSRYILRGLAQICIRPQDRSRRLRSTCNLQEIHDIFSVQMIDEMKQPNKSLIIGCLCRHEDRHLVDDVNAKCLELYNGLSQNGIDDTNRLPDNARSTDLDGTLIEFTDDLFEKIQDYAQCDPSSHPDMTDHVQDETLWHPARLCLSEEGQKATSVTFLLSAANMIYWQGFRLTISLPDDHSDHSDFPTKEFPWNRFCDHQETPTYNYISMCYEPFTEKFQIHEYELPSDQNQLPGPGRGATLLNVIRDYLLTPKDKVILAYIIARAYWQFYDSELMRTKWTSESIWFLPQWTPLAEDVSLPEEILLRPYLAFPFGLPEDPLEDVINDDMLNHKHPRIFRIGILLLEIGLGRPFPSFKRPNLVSQLNLDHQIASSQFAELRRESWAGFRYKSYFDSAVGHCIQSQKLVKQSSPLSSRAKDEHEGVLARRKAFYKNVVQPLAWLARKGFRHGPEDITLIRRKAVSMHGAQTHNIPLLPKARFHSGNEVVPKKWLKTLNELSREIEGQRRKAGVKTRIRVAVLDTGLNLQLPEFADPDGRIKRVQDVKDFVDQPKGNDTFGHGSFMARLVMECAPSADIYVARVARNSTDLSRSQVVVQKVIPFSSHYIEFCK
ncbi:hypothetical protein CcaCcLH18_02713 [Colletotrichum camelliae]|nr:hypothetical protein CcaCcLH18_02713 [Colletotrichum camelliae]